MQFRSVRALRGPSIWARVPVLEAVVELGKPGQSPAPVEPLPGWLPSAPEDLRWALEPGDLLAQMCRELQTRAGTPVEFARSEQTADPGVCHVIVGYEYEALGRACLETARRFCGAILRGESLDVATEVRRLRALEYRVRPGAGAAAVVRAARARGIPVEPIDDPASSLFRLGQGAKQRRVGSARTDRTPALAQVLAQDKELTRKLLAEAGIPVPEGRPVADADDACRAARELGPPVVVKPRDSDNGRGVALDLKTDEQVRAAYAAARAESSDVLVERQAPGRHHRLVVIGGRLVAAARRDPAQVVGDGAHPVAQLVDRANADPRRGDDGPLWQIPLDEHALEVLAGQGLTPGSVPPAGAPVLLRRNSHLQDGGTVADVTDRVHPQLAARAVEAVRVLGLDVAGLDVVVE